MRVAVEGERQGEHMGEIAAHGGEAVAVGKALGLHHHRHVGDDAGGADGRPQAEQRAGLVPQIGRVDAVAGREQADHPAEQHGVEELQAGDDRVRGDQHQDHVAFRGEEAEHPAIDRDKTHPTVRQPGMGPRKIARPRSPERDTRPERAKSDRNMSKWRQR